MSNDNYTHDPNATGAVPGFGAQQPAQQTQGWPQQGQQQWPGAQQAPQQQWPGAQQGYAQQGYAPAAPKRPFPLTIRELIVGAVGLLILVFSFITWSGDGYASVWSFGILWMLLVIPVVAASALVVLRAFTPAVRRVGSLSVDQFASTVYSWTLAIYLIVGISIVMVVNQLLAGLGSFFGGSSSSGLALPWPVWVTLFLLVVGVVATVVAPFIPGLREEFDQRAEETAPRAGRTTRVLPAKQATAHVAQPYGAAPAAQQQGWGQQDPNAFGQQSAGFGAPAPQQQWGAQPGAAQPAAQQQWPAQAAEPQWPAPAADQQQWAAAPAAEQQWPAQAAEPQWSAPAEQQAWPSPDAAPVEHVDPEIASAAPAEAAPADAAPVEAAPVEAEPAVAEALVIEPEPVAVPVSEQPAAEQPAAQQPFWALAPVERDVVDSNGAPIFTVTPLAWALVVEDRGDVFVIRHDDGRIGFLMDVSGVTRG